MKKLFVLSALLLTATFGFTSCEKKTTETETTIETNESVETVEADTTTIVTPAVEATVTTGDTVKTN